MKTIFITIGTKSPSKLHTAIEAIPDQRIESIREFGIPGRQVKAMQHAIKLVFLTKNTETGLAATVGGQKPHGGRLKSGQIAGRCRKAIRKILTALRGLGSRIISNRPLPTIFS
jgi:hypothetical protein